MHQSDSITAWKSNVERRTSGAILPGAMISFQRKGFKNGTWEIFKISYVLFGAELSQRLYTLVSFRIVVVSHPWLLELRGVSNLFYVLEYVAILPHNQKTF